ncbi:MAG: LysE/ArgO family amino acid transporter [Pseudomonadota bacterium]
MTPATAAALTGFLTGASLILAIGAQNAFVLRQGLLRQHVFWVCLTCSLSDAVLICAGVAGMCQAVQAAPMLLTLVLWGGAVFLFVYGALAVRRELRPGRLQAAEGGSDGLWVTLVTCLALTWLNPHVYLDTVVLLGAVSTPFSAEGDGIAFAMGAVLGSFAFFFSLGYGARLLAPLFARPSAWRVLDGFVALVMWTIGTLLVAEALHGA